MKWWANARSNQLGGAMLISLVFSAVLVVMLMGVVSSTAIEAKITSNSIMKKQAQYAAEAAVELAKSKLQDDPKTWNLGHDWIGVAAGGPFEFRYKGFASNQVGVYRSFEVQGRVKNTGIIKDIKVWLAQGWNNTIIADNNLNIGEIKKITNAALAANRRIEVGQAKKISQSRIAAPVVVAPVSKHYDYTKIDGANYIRQPIPEFDGSKIDWTKAIKYNRDINTGIDKHDFVAFPIMYVNGNVIIDKAKASGTDDDDDENDDKDSAESDKKEDDEDGDEEDDEDEDGNDGDDDESDDDSKSDYHGVIIIATGTVTIKTQITNSVIIAGSVRADNAGKVSGLLYSTDDYGAISITGRFKFEGAMGAHGDINMSGKNIEIKGSKKEKQKKDDDDEDEDEDDDEDNMVKGPAEKAMELVNTNAPGALSSKWKIAKWVELN